MRFVLEAEGGEPKSGVRWPGQAVGDDPFGVTGGSAVLER